MPNTRIESKVGFWAFDFVPQKNSWTLYAPYKEGNHGDKTEFYEGQAETVDLALYAARKIIEKREREIHSPKPPRELRDHGI